MKECFARSASIRSIRSCAHARGVLDQLFVVDHFERGEAAGHGEVVAAEGGRVDDATVHPAEGLLINVAPRDNRAARDVAAAQSLRQGDDVRLQVPMLEAKHLAGAPEAGLDFVADEKRAVFSAKLLGPIKEIALRDIDAFALDRLDDEGGDVAFRQLAFERRRDHRARCGRRILHQRAEAFGETFAAHQGKRAEAEAMKRSA